MPLKEPFTDLDIHKTDRGFYRGNSVPIAVISKAFMIALVLWALIWPANANGALGLLNWEILQGFNAFYVLIGTLFTIFLFLIAIFPQTGSRVMGPVGQKPEFGNFSWFSMMFGAGLGVGLMVFATAEPLGLWGSNPEIIAGNVEPNTPEAVQSAYRYTFLHYGFLAWSIYVVTGLSLAYFAYTRDMPLTIRTALTPLFGRALNGPLGHLVDIIGVVATILGVSVTVGFGVSQFVDGLFAITGIAWLMDMGGEVPKPSTVGLVAGLLMIMVLSIISAVSGVGRGVKYLSNLNLVLSLTLLGTFVIFGSFAFSMSTYVSALMDYILNYLSIGLSAYTPLSADTFAGSLPEAALPFAGELQSAASNPWGSFDGFRSGLEGAPAALDEDTLRQVYAAGEQGRQFAWQAAWTTFYIAWWIAFSPFVGLFLARISRGRSVREFIVGCVLLPSLVVFGWMTILGATAIDLELSGIANGVILEATDTNKLFATLGVMIDGPFLQFMTVLCVVLILTFLVTSADSGILVMNTIMSGGQQDTDIKHRIVWGVILTLVIGTLLVAGKTQAGTEPMDSLKSAMIIGALPFAMIMCLMCVSLTKALIRDNIREKQ